MWHTYLVANSELTNYIKEELQKGTFKFIVVNNLLHSGWKKEDITAAYASLEKDQSWKNSPKNPLVQSRNTPPPLPTRLPPIDRPYGKIVNQNGKITYHAVEPKRENPLVQMVRKDSVLQLIIKRLLIILACLILIIIIDFVLKLILNSRQENAAVKECTINCQRTYIFSPEKIKDCENRCERR